MHKPMMVMIRTFGKIRPFFKYQTLSNLLTNLKKTGSVIIACLRTVELGSVSFQQENCQAFKQTSLTLFFQNQVFASVYLK